MSNNQTDRGPESYEHHLSRWRRALTREFRWRSFTMQSMWILILAAGAAVPLSAAVGWPAWVAPTLGFVVVVATGIDRIFVRTTGAAVAVDTLRRQLERERRALDAGLFEDGPEPPFSRYVRNCESAIAEYDATMVAYSQTLSRESRE